MDVQQARAALTNGSITLTDKAVRELPAPPKGSVIYTDGGSVEVRVTAAGARAWVYRYRHLGRSITLTIGDPQNWKAAAARNEAKRIAKLVDKGRDPHGEKRAAREAPTVKELCDRYLEVHAARKRTEAQDRRMIDTIIRPALGARKVAEIEFEHVDQLHRRITTKGTRTGHGRATPYVANRVASLLGKMFALSIKWKMRSDNPTLGVERNVEQKRKRYLKPDELTRLTAALAAHPDQAIADALRMLLLTGARKSEVLSARFAQFDGDIWTKPASETKQKRDHEVSVSGAVQEIVARRRAATSAAYLFPGRGTEHLVEIKKAWATICKAADLQNFRIHDLRHSAASFLVSNGASLPLIGAILGHSRASTTQRYAHLLRDPQKAAVEELGNIVMQRPKAPVVPLRGRR
jgi:integrase